MCLVRLRERTKRARPKSTPKQPPNSTNAHMTGDIRCAYTIAILRVRKVWREGHFRRDWRAYTPPRGKKKEKKNQKTAKQKKSSREREWREWETSFSLSTSLFSLPTPLVQCIACIWRCLAYIDLFSSGIDNLNRSRWP